MVTVAIKRKLETALKNSLQQALIEMESVGKIGFSEEALRYLVMSEISKQEYWGTFPNEPKTENKLLFEQEYHRLKIKRKTLKPDIVSINENEHLLAIELKIKSDISDVEKCKEYIDQTKGRACFKLAACVYAIHKDLTQIAWHVETKIKHANKIGINRKNGRLLVAFIEWHDDFKYFGQTNNYQKRIRLEWIY